MSDTVVNVIIAGLGGQGVIKASDVLAEAAFLAGRDVKKAEIHGMSQRGGSVSSDVRFGRQVLSPMIPVGEADFLVVIDPTQVEVNRHQLKPGGTLIQPGDVDADALPSKRSLNVAMLGILSRHLDIDAGCWHAALRSAFPQAMHEANQKAFEIGRG